MKKIIVPAGILVAVVMGIFGYKTLVYTKDGEPQSSQTSIPLRQKQEQPANSLALPPDPGEAGKATLQGTDSDRDGVRGMISNAILP